MRKLPLLALFLLACQQKPAPPAGRPKDVCAEVKAQVACAVLPEHAPPGISAAGNCYDVGNQQYHCGLFEAAEVSLALSAKLEPTARAYHALGEAQLVQEKYPAARDSYQQALKLDAHKRESWVRLAQVQVYLGKPTEAHQAAARARELDPNKPDADRVDADAYAAEGDYAKAIDLLHRAAKNGNASEARAAVEHEVQVLTLELRKLKKDHADLERIAEAQGQLADALERELALNVEAKPAERVRLYGNLADARLAAGQLDKAEEALQKSAALDPKDFVSSRLVGVLREKRGDAAGARQALLASLKVQPKQAMPFIVLGRLDAAAGDLEAARKDFAQALANESGKDALETRQLAALALKVGAADKAEALYQSLDTDPDVSAKVDFWLDRARASQALHHATEVKKACERAHKLVESIDCPPKAPRGPARSP